MTALTLPLKVDLKNVHFTDEQFYQLCINNPELNVERDSKGTLIVMAPVGGDSGNREADYIIDLYSTRLRMDISKTDKNAFENAFQ